MLDPDPKNLVPEPECSSPVSSIPLLAKGIKVAISRFHNTHTAPMIGKIHLEIVGMDVEEQDPIVPLVRSHRLDHTRSEEPIVNLPTGRLVLQTLETEVGNRERLLLRAVVHRHIARHEHLRRLPDENRKLDVLPDVLRRRVVKILQPEVENLLLGGGGGGGVGRRLPAEALDERDVADGGLEVPVGRLEAEHALAGLDGLAVVLGKDGDLEEGRHVPVVFQRAQAPL
jgi:hypothetical protein